MEVLNNCINTFNSNLFNFSNLSIELLNLIGNRQKSLIIELNDRLANLDKSTLTYENCFEYNMREESKYSTIIPLMYFSQLHQDKEIRIKSSDLNKELSSFEIEQSMRQDVYDVISHYYFNQFKEEKQSLSPEQIKYIEKTMIGYKMLGLGLNEESKEKVKELNKQLSIYSSDYKKNLAEVNTEFEFDSNQLEGMDEIWLANRLIAGKDKYKVKLQYPDYVPILEYCKVRETRKFMAEAMGSRCMDTNLQIILDTIRLRKEKANLFGFDSNTDFKLQNMMAKNSSTVMEFLSKLLNIIKPVVKTDKEKLLSLAIELDGLEKIESYDNTYYSRIYRERVSGLNMVDLKKMFSIESVTNGIFDIYQELLGLKFIDITESNPQALYADNIKLFCVYDSKDNELTKPMGYFYLDLFPREGKYGHAAMFTFIRGSKYKLPLSAIVCNFDPLMNVDFNNVVTYFHEFGHLMHNMVSNVSISYLSGTACQIDFVETPSQMFEEWCYCKEPLKRLVMPEFIDTINDELIDKINKQRKQLLGIANARQLLLSLLDQVIHSNNIPEDTWIYYNNLNKEICDWEISPKTNILANWDHMFGYDSSYYGYLWSKVYAIDLFSFFKSDPLNQELGMRLREEILAKGGSLDGFDLLRNFMGRDPNPNAYIQWLSE